MNNEKEAAISLVERALSSESQSTAYLLIDSAHRIDPSIDVVAYKRQWLNGWMEREYRLLLSKTA